MSKAVEHLPGSLKAASVFNFVFDRFLRLDRGDRVAWLDIVRRALARFPDLDVRDRPSLLRGIVIANAMNRIVFRVQSRFPAAAVRFSRYVRIDRRGRSTCAPVPANRPIVIGLMHFGPIYAAITVAMNLLAGRRVYIFHAGGEIGHAVSRYFSAIGAIPILNEPGSLRIVEAALIDRPASAAIVCFDYLGGYGSQTVSFLGNSISVATGLARLAQSTNAVVVTGLLETRWGLPFLHVSDMHEFDELLEPAAARREFTERMYGILERRVREVPHAWTEWQSC